MSRQESTRSASAALCPREIGDAAVTALRREIETWPKPGLVSLVDSGSHADMDAAMFYASADALRPCFVALAEEGAMDAEMADLRAIGREAEREMLEATGGVNTHRGAIFSLGLLCAAAGALGGNREAMRLGSLGAYVRRRWGNAIHGGPIPEESHGAQAWRRYGAGGARVEAAAGFPHVYLVGLSALQTSAALAPADDGAGRVQVCFALISALEDTNLLHRSGVAGLRFAQQAARSFLSAGGVGRPDWLDGATEIHREFVRRWLSPGGSADLLAATLLVHALESPEADGGDLQESQPSAPGVRLSCFRSF